MEAARERAARPAIVKNDVYIAENETWESWVENKEDESIGCGKGVNIHPAAGKWF
jgi:2-hydroxy-3-keto-5-methylthiopentenyl-1-phosphate phosphatase